MPQEPILPKQQGQGLTAPLPHRLLHPSMVRGSGVSLTAVDMLWYRCTSVYIREFHNKDNTPDHHLNLN